MSLTKRDIINYLVDVKGYGVEESLTITNVYGSKYLNELELKECIEFNN